MASTYRPVAIITRTIPGHDAPRFFVVEADGTTMPLNRDGYSRRIGALRAMGRAYDVRIAADGTCTIALSNRRIEPRDETFVCRIVDHDVAVEQRARSARLDARVAADAEAGAAMVARADASSVAALDDEAQEGLILRRYITTAIAAGYALSVHDGGCVTVSRSQDAEAVFSALRTTSEDRLIYARRVGDTWQTVGSVLFVYGNSPWEVAADASTSLDDVTAEADAYAASFEPQAPAMVPQPVQQQQAQDMRDCGQVPSTITLPEHWACYLINGDASGLDDGEAERIAEHLNRELPADAAIVDAVEGSERFTWSYALYGGEAQGGTVADYTVLRPGARAAVQRAGATA